MTTHTLSTIDCNIVLPLFGKDTPDAIYNIQITGDNVYENVRSAHLAIGNTVLCDFYYDKEHDAFVTNDFNFQTRQTAFLQYLSFEPLKIMISAAKPCKVTTYISEYKIPEKLKRRMYSRCLVVDSCGNLNVLVYQGGASKFMFTQKLL